MGPRGVDNWGAVESARHHSDQHQLTPTTPNEFTPLDGTQPLSGFYEFCNTLVGDSVFIKEAVVFFHEWSAELGCECRLLGVKSIDFAGEHLAEVGDVAVDGLG
jgi:hypothetical protein